MGRLGMPLFQLFAAYFRFWALFITLLSRVGRSGSPHLENLTTRQFLESSK